MLAFTLRRLVVAFCVAFTVSVIAFVLLHMSGDLATAIAGPEASPAQVAEVRPHMGSTAP